MKKIIKPLLLILVLSPLLLYVLAQIIPSYGAYVVTSGSMEPELPENSIIYTHKVPESQINIGDTITFQRDQLTITHKVINKTENQNSTEFTTKGVANINPDVRPVRYNQIQGKKLFSIPYLGHIPRLLQTKIAMILLIIVPSIALAAFETANIVSEIK